MVDGVDGGGTVGVVEVQGRGGTVGNPEGTENRKEESVGYGFKFERTIEGLRFRRGSGPTLRCGSS